MNEFKDRVQFSRFGEDDEKTPGMREDIRILKTILETALEEQFETNLSSDFIQGTYLDGFGILFTTDVNKLNLWSTKYNVVLRAYEDSRRALRVPRTRDAKDEKEEKDPDQLIEELKTTLSEIIADFGHTLRGLKNNEKVYVFISNKNGVYFADGLSRDKKANFMMIVTKENIEAYRNERIDIEEFKDRTVFKEF